MRITDPQVIQNGEQDLIASVQRDLDLEAVKDLLKERLTASALSPKGGRIVVHDNDVAFRLDYEINLNASLLFDRKGNLLEDGLNSAPKQDLQDEDTPVSEIDADSAVDFPDYDDAQDPPPAETPSKGMESEDLSDKIQDAELGFEIEDTVEDSKFDQDDSDDIETIDENEEVDLTVEELTALGLEDGDKESGNDMDEKDINDLLQESRDFWENKKD